MGLLVIIALLLILAWWWWVVMYWDCPAPKPDRTAESLRNLEERYARGEIGKEEFEPTLDRCRSKPPMGFFVIIGLLLTLASWWWLVMY